jgi:uncharacterized protein involved in exopolysaccharide biosynthesis
MAEDPSDGLDFLGLCRTAWAARKLVIVFALLCGAIAAVVAFMTKPVFRAEVVVAEVKSNGVNGPGGLASQLGGLASLAGINLDSGNGTNVEARAELQSRRMVEDFIESRHLLNVLLPPSGKPPTMWKAVKRFREGVITIREDKRTALTTIAIEWEDPVVAADWANSFVALANDRIRARAIDDATRNIEYLNKQIAKTNVVDLQKVMYNLVESETKTLMLANVHAEYAFRIIDPAVPPEIKAGPHRAIMTLVGLLLGAIVGVGIAVFRARTGKPPDPIPS